MKGDIVVFNSRAARIYRGRIGVVVSYSFLGFPHVLVDGKLCDFTSDMFDLFEAGR